MDVMSRSDPFVCVYLNDTYLQRTECIDDNPNPKFAEKIYLDYKFHAEQVIKLEVYDKDKDLPSDLKKPVQKKANDVIVTCSFKLGEYMKSSICQELSVINKGKESEVIVYIEEVRVSKEFYSMNFKVTNLPVRNFFKEMLIGQRKFRLILEKQAESGSFNRSLDLEIDETSGECAIKNMSSSILCSSDSSRPLKLAVYKVHSSGDYEMIEESNTNFGEILEKSHFKPKFINIDISNINVEVKPSFCDYLQYGLNLNSLFSVDFTGSNGNPTYKNSLHYIDPKFDYSNYNTYNQYQKAISNVASIILQYDYDKLVPMYGFGAYMNALASTNHCFPMFNPQNVPNSPETIFATYSDYLRGFGQVFNLSGPTFFAPTINETIKLAEQDVANNVYSNYYNLVILTDGAISDLSQTLACITKASRLPMSLIIVGVGNADFSTMDRLDGDGKLLKDDNGVACVRDMVQFVALRDYTDRNLFTKDLLSELPNQVVQYYKFVKKSPQDLAK